MLQNLRQTAPGQLTDAQRAGHAPIAQFGQFTLYARHIVQAPATGWTVPIGDPSRKVAHETYWLAGVTAEVAESGNVTSRGSLTRTVFLGGWQKKVDARNARLTISGPGFYWEAQVQLGGQFSTLRTQQARDFAAKVNHAARQSSIPMM